MKKKVKNGLDAPRDEAQRKLHAAAEKYIGICFFLRPQNSLTHPSPDRFAYRLRASWGEPAQHPNILLCRRVQLALRLISGGVQPIFYFLLHSSAQLLLSGRNNRFRSIQGEVCNAPDGHTALILAIPPGFKQFYSVRRVPT